MEIIRCAGVWDWSVGFFGFKKEITKKEAKTSADSKKTGSKKKHSSSKSKLSDFINPQLLVAVKNAFLKLVQALHLKVKLSGIYGFEDPSLTGIMAGVMAASARGGSSIDLNPDFTREVVDIRGSIRGWLSPWQIIVIGLGFFLKKSVRAIWWPKIKFRKKEKGAVQYA